MFQQIAVTCQQNGHRAAQHLPEREVPWHYRENRPQRTVFNDRVMVFHQRGFRTQHRRAMLGIPVTQTGGFCHFRPRLQDGFSHFTGDGLRHLFCAVSQRCAEIPQLLRPVGHAFASPLVIPRVRLRNRAFNLFRRRPGEGTEGFPRCRVNGQGMCSR